MNHHETNVYIIENLQDLNLKYRLYSVKGIPIDSEEYHQNKQFLVDKLSRTTRSPCICFTKDNETFIAQPDNHPELPKTFDVVRATAKIEILPELQNLDFTDLREQDVSIALRFLNFWLQNPLHRNPSLWQPQSGYPFYQKKPDHNFRRNSEDIDLYRGFIFRVVALPNSKIGICIDTRSKYVARHPLPTNIANNDFRKIKGSNCLYQYGDYWYEIRIAGLNNLKCQEVLLPDGTNLFDNVHKMAGNYKTPELMALPRDCSVLIYYTKHNEPRNMPSGLCKLTYRTNHPQIKRYHHLTIKPPAVRHSEITFIVDNYFRNLKVGDTTIKLSDKPYLVNETIIDFPDIEFGNNVVLSSTNRPNAISCDFRQFGSKKKELLYSSFAGFHVKKPFDRQYIIMPRSIYNSYGTQFINDIDEEIKRSFPDNISNTFSIIPITYDDSVQKSVYNLGKVILNAVDGECLKSGYGVVMIPTIPSKKLGKEDILANLVMREMRLRGLFMTVIHTKTLEQSYDSVSGQDGEKEWKLVMDTKQQGKYKGYVKNVVLNKILLLNSFWPFVLKTPLHADVTIGIDVKNNFAGFTIIYKTGRNTRFFWSESGQKERLSKKYISVKIIELLKSEKKSFPNPIRKVVIHRDGTLYPSERAGIENALQKLAEDGVIESDYSCDFIEIRNTSRTPFRLFSVITPTGSHNKVVQNPRIGTYVPFRNEAFICNTGYPYGHKGSTNPLHAIKVDGPTDFDTLVRDVFYLANLTWTKVDDCSRDPLTIKLTDVRLREIGGEYDEDALKYGEEEEGGERDE